MLKETTGAFDGVQTNDGLITTLPTAPNRPSRMVAIVCFFSIVYTKLQSNSIKLYCISLNCYSLFADFNNRSSEEDSGRVDAAGKTALYPAGERDGE